MVNSVPVPGKLIEFIRDGSKFILAGHEEPDGDCIGSILALCSVLRRLGKEAIPFSAGPFKRTEVIPYAGRFKLIPDEAEKSGARLLLVDCSELSRTGELQPHLAGLPIAIIDHHASGKNIAAPENAPFFLDPGSPSVTLMVHTLIEKLGLELTREEASLLLFGLCTDTGFFRHVDDSGEGTFLKAAELIRAGASPKQAFLAINGGKSLDSRILLGRVLSRSRSYFNGRLIISFEEYADLETLGASSRDSDSLYQLLQAVQGVEAIAFIRQDTPEKFSVGLRSREIDVGAIAASLGGGGHKNAAGFISSEDISIIKKNILDKFQNIF